MENSDMAGNLNPHEQKRYQRMMALPGYGAAVLEKIKTTRVLVVGAGALGATVLQHLAMCGFSQLGVVDNDLVSEENLAGQTFFGSKDLGKQKAIAARDKLGQLNHLCKVEIFNICLSETNARTIIKEFDLVVDCTDNFPAKFLINDVCTHLRKPWFFGYTNAFKGYFASLNGATGPTLRCLFPEPRKTSDIFGTGSEYGIANSLVGTFMAHSVVCSIAGTDCAKPGWLNSIDLENLTVSSAEISINRANLSV